MAMFQDNNTEKKQSKSIVSTLLLSAVLILCMILFAEFIGLGKGGFSFTVSPSDTAEINFVLFQFLFYAGPGIGFLLGILVLFVVELVIVQGDADYGNSISFMSAGEEPGLPGGYFKGFKGTMKLIMLSIIVCSCFGMYAAVNHQTFTGIGTLKAQFTLGDNLVYTSALIPASENLGAAFTWAFALVIWRAICRKNKINKGVFIVISVLLAILAFGAYGFINHQLRYGFNEVAIMSVLVFWCLGGLITVVSGSFIPFWLLHIANNLFYELGNNFASDKIMIYGIAFVILMSIAYILLFVRRSSNPRMSKN
jgi:hypothetical protein